MLKETKKMIHVIEFMELLKVELEKGRGSRFSPWEREDSNLYTAHIKLIELDAYDVVKEVLEAADCYQVVDLIKDLTETTRDSENLAKKLFVHLNYFTKSFIDPEDVEAEILSYVLYTHGVYGWKRSYNMALAIAKKSREVKWL